MIRPVLVGAVVFLVGVMAVAAYTCERTRRHKTRFVMHDVSEAVVHFKFDHADVCPPTLRALVDGGYLARLPRDEWDQPLAYRCLALHAPDDVETTSAGPDRRFGTADDLHSRDDH
jgi:hypothetical protein